MNQQITIKLASPMDNDFIDYFILHTITKGKMNSILPASLNNILFKLIGRFEASIIFFILAILKLSVLWTNCIYPSSLWLPVWNMATLLPCRQSWEDTHKDTNFGTSVVHRKQKLPFMHCQHDMPFTRKNKSEQQKSYLHKNHFIQRCPLNLLPDGSIGKCTVCQKRTAKCSFL